MVLLLNLLWRRFSFERLVATLLLFLIILLSSRRTQATVVVHLPVQHHEFVTLTVGNPGDDRLLRLDFSANTTLTLFSLPSSYSQSYAQYRSATSGSELIYIGSERMRVDTAYGSAAMRYDTPVSYHGVLGLGARSHLWRRWCRFSYSSNLLSLGEFDRSLERSTYLPFSVIVDTHPPNSYVRAHNRHTSVEYQVRYEPGEPYTRLPLPLYNELVSGSGQLELRVGSAQLNTHFSLTISHADYMVRMPNSFEYPMLRAQRRGSTEVVLGEYSTRSFVSHNDWVIQKREIHPAYSMFDSGDTQAIFDSVCSVLLALVYAYWLALVMGERNRNAEKRVRLVATYAYVVCAVVALTESKAYVVERYLSHLLGEESSSLRSTAELLPALICLLAVVSASVSTLLHRRRHRITIHRLLLEPTLLLTMWLCQAAYGTTKVRLMFSVLLSALALVSTMLVYGGAILRLGDPEPAAVVATTSPPKGSMVAQFLRRDQLLHAVGIVSVVGLATFLLFFNLIPFQDCFWYGYPLRAESIAILAVCVVAIPFIYVFFGVHISKQQATIELLKGHLNTTTAV